MKTEKAELKKYHVWGLSLLQLMGVLFVLGIVLHTVINMIF
ncbi:MAG: hypothetical protein P4M12_01345 [Gammaproteobacteria bacterium]|nr:hypothetical protein [Gammaproteobacteria bacterium]